MGGVGGFVVAFGGDLRGGVKNRDAKMSGIGNWSAAVPSLNRDFRGRACAA